MVSILIITIPDAQAYEPGGQGAEAPPPDSGKVIIFRTKTTFNGQKPAAKNEKNIFFLYLLNEKN